MRGGADAGDDAGDRELARAELRLVNDLDAMARIPDWVEGFGAAHGLRPAVINDLNVALDEVVSNAIVHGYAAGAPGEIVVRLRCRRSAVTAEVEDDGRPFDPLQAPPPDLTAPLAERPVGGLGLHFVRNLMDKVSYARVGARNVLKMLRNLDR
jgi:anti-sigma regulatory factor (Ser/Thr protein kinase)